MGDAADPLYTPLGPRPPAATRLRRRWLLPAGVAVLGVAAGAWALRHPRAPDPTVAVAAIETPPQASAPAPAPVPPPADPAIATTTAPAVVAAPPAAAADATTVEIQNGVRIVRFNPSAGAHGMTAIPVPPLPGTESIALKPAPDPRVTETTRMGPLPRIGAGGLRPADVYARPSGVVAGPRLALLVTGMGADQLLTANAARALAPAVSFAFAPTVADAVAQVAETRRAGHEVMLDLSAAIPDGDIDANDPLAGLHRRMASVPGYAGVTAGAEAAPAALRDIAGRGLMLVAAAPQAGTAALVPDLSVDAAASRADVAAGLDRLLGLARSQGTAFGMVAATPVSAADIAAFVASLDKAGVTLVPVTAMAKARLDNASK